MSSSPQYANPETREKLAEARQELERREKRDQIEAATTTATARETIASEEQPDPDGDALPQPSAKVVEWCGSELTFDKLGGGPLIQIEKYREADDHVGMFEYLIDLLEEKCHHPAADAAYWSDFDLMEDDSDDDDSLIELFMRLTGAGDLSPEELEAVENLRQAKRES